MTSSIQHREWLCLFTIFAVAALLRFYHLVSMPLGLHGDEAVAGIEALRILRDGYIGPYTTSALGQPLGPMYFMALPVKLLGNTILAVRVLPALWGALSIPALWWLARRHLPEKNAPAIALLAAGSLTFLNWHLHFSRIGFPVGLWPLWTILSITVLLEATQTQKTKWWLATGAMTGGGIYVYNAHSLFLVLTTVFVAVWILGEKTNWTRRLKSAAAYFAALTLVLVPMATYAAQPEHGYWSHAGNLSIFQTPEWSQQTRLGPKVGFLVGRYLNYWDRLSLHPVPEYTDSIGGDENVPAAPPLTLLFVGGAVLMLARKFRDWRAQPLLFYSAFIVLAMPMVGVVTINAFERRSLAAAAFFCILAAWGGARCFEKLEARFPRRRAVFSFAAALLCVWFAGRSTYDYFGKYALSNNNSWVMCEELTDAIKWAKTQPPDSTIYFLSDRWSFNYEPRQYLAPELRGEDRSRQFGNFDLGFDAARGHPIFICIGEYSGQIAALEARYPNGKVVVGPPVYRDAKRPSFYAFLP